jgi:uncharacterized protein YdaU (DUF1376 family)
MNTNNNDARLPYFPFFVDAWLSSAKVNGFTVEQRGAYLALLIHQWNAPNGILTKDEYELSFLSGLKKRWRTVGRPIVKSCFVEKGHGIINPRLFREWQKAHERSAKARKAIETRWK